MLKFEVGKLLSQPVGTREKFTLSGPTDFEGITLKSDLKAKCELMHIDEGIAVQLDNITVDVGIECEKCLEIFTTNIIIDSAQRKMLLKEPQEIEDPEDIFLIDQKNRTIDLLEPLRQEIILHFPAIPVCSTSCKGICAFCGVEKNKQTCNCKEVEVPKNKPLAALKDLFKDKK
jgi:uncharacterized metal-binding protein YceD (DUF177 family)